MLHAYLDGAFHPGDIAHAQITGHVATCEHCRVRLEEARALREQAVQILRDAGPHEVRVPVQSWLPRRRRLQWTAWAVSIVLALTVGWLARETSGSAGRDSKPASSVASETRGVPVDQTTAVREIHADAEDVRTAAIQPDAQDTTATSASAEREPPSSSSPIRIAEVVPQPRAAPAVAGSPSGEPAQAYTVFPSEVQPPATRARPHPGLRQRPRPALPLSPLRDIDRWFRSGRRMPEAVPPLEVGR